MKKILIALYVEYPAGIERSVQAESFIGLWKNDMLREPFRIYPVAPGTNSPPVEISIAHYVYDLLQKYKYCAVEYPRYVAFDRIGSNRETIRQFVDPSQDGIQFSFETFCAALNKRMQ